MMTILTLPTHIGSFIKLKQHLASLFVANYNAKMEKIAKLWRNLAIFQNFCLINYKIDLSAAGKFMEIY